MVMIEVRDLKKTFRAGRQQRRQPGRGRGEKYIRAVDGITFRCEPGRIFTLLGPNGAGKTTTLRLIATLLKPVSGSIHIDGIDVVRDPMAARRKLGFLTGSTRLYDRLTPHELVKYYADLHRVDRAVFRKRRDDLFSMLDMHEFAHTRIGKLSTGMKQKVSIARTMIHDPQVMVFDEPTVGLDVITSRAIVTLIRQVRDEGKTVIFSTHIMGEVSRLSDDLAVLHRGRLCYNGTYADFAGRMQSATLEEEFIRVLQETDV